VCGRSAVVVAPRPVLRAVTFTPGAAPGMWCLPVDERDAMIEDMSKLMALVDLYEAQARAMANGNGGR
jgi:hypothetical protein